MHINLAIVEDNIRFQEGLDAIIKESFFMEIVGKYDNGKDSIKGILEKRPDIVLIDIGLPDISGIEVIKKVREESYKTEFLVLTVYDDDNHLFSALKAGASGYIIKDQISNSEIVEAIHEICVGEAPMSRGLAKRVLDEFKSLAGISKNSKIQLLTEREMEILKHLAKGFSTKRVADKLFIGYETVRSHQKSIYKKLHVNSLVEAVLVYREK